MRGINNQEYVYYLKTKSLQFHSYLTGKHHILQYESNTDITGPGGPGYRRG